ncbi:MAG: TolC family protein, partial [Planctomycetes bacterium]|nr:TolC family protein [Planctomycetota bacterium]
QSLKNQLESFKLKLNLSPKTKLSLIPFIANYSTLEEDAEQQVKSALKHRLDYQTAADSLEDAKRKYAFARNRLLPDLSFNLNANIQTEEDSSNLYAQDFEQHSYSSSLNLDLPLDKTADRQNLYNSQNTLKQRERDFKLLAYQISIEIKNRIRQIKQLEDSIEIQNLILESEKTRYGVAEFRFQSGEVSNREVIEASESLTDAENTKIDLYLNHFIAKLRLKKDLGLMDLDFIFELLKQDS